MIQIPLNYTPAELQERLAQVPDAFRLSDGELIHWGARSTRELKGDEARAYLRGIRFSGERGVREALRWLLLLPYEAFRDQERRQQPERRAAPWLSEIAMRYYPATITSTPTGSVLFAESRADANLLLEILAEAPKARGADQVGLKLTAQEDPELHRRRIEVALAEIAQGELYQVNLARRFEYEVVGTALELYQALGPQGTAPFAAALNDSQTSILSNSPELFLDICPSGRIRTRPIKGTRPRGKTPAQDARLRAELDQSEKERAELTMVIDIERNDLGKLCKLGSVRMNQAPQVVSYPVVHHREAEVEGSLRENIDLLTILEGSMPSGSVTGAPKIRAMDLIAELEAHRRGLYTGALGYLSESGRLRLSMTIRTLVIREGKGHYFAGGGIVADSDAEMEIAETHWKAAQLGQ